MQQLKKIKSQQLLDRLFNNNNRKNYYQHHNLPARETHNNFMKTASLSNRMNRLKEQPKQIGRQLYPEIIKRVEDPGPGSYDFFKEQPKSFTFKTIHTSTGKRKVIQARSRQQRIGPGFYRYENINSINFLSQNKKPLMTKIITSPQKQERLTFTIPDTPAPGIYQTTQMLSKTSNHLFTKSYKISDTARSSLIRSDKLPGPGYYNWDKYYDKSKQKKAPCIQYKFVYGHPS